MALIISSNAESRTQNIQRDLCNLKTKHMILMNQFLLVIQKPYIQKCDSQKRLVDQFVISLYCCLILLDCIYSL